MIKIHGSASKAAWFANQHALNARFDKREYAEQYWKKVHELLEKENNPMNYGLQVKIAEGFGEKRREVWRDVRPTGADPYRWETRDAAEYMGRMCYRDPAIYRVVDVVNK